MKLLALAVVLGLALPAFGQRPAAQQILRGARQAAVLQNQDLSGTLIKREAKISVRVQLFLRQENIQFQFYNTARKSWEVFHLRLKDKGYDLFEMRGGKTHRFAPAKLKERILGTDLSYEDLALRFLYWPGGKVIREDRIATRNCWLVRVRNPQPGVGRYALVDVWVDQKSGALIRVVGYDGGNPAQPLKRFQVQEIMQVGNTHTLETMRVDRFDRLPGETGITYLKFDKPKEKKPAGMR